MAFTPAELEAMRLADEEIDREFAERYVEANNIEKILEDIDCLLTNAARAWFYSGEAFSGEV